MRASVRWAVIWPAVLLVAACATSPTGQQQLRLFPDAEMTRMGVAAFEQVKKDSSPSKDERTTAYVRCVASAVTREARADIAWEVVVFESEEINAFALPGGKIGVYTGILDVAQNQHQLAAILSHEIVHVIGEHANARVSAAYATQAGLQIAELLMGASTAQKQNTLALLGLGAQYGVLMPYGRSQETESDLVGLDIMASAGFDPREAVQLWHNMSKASRGRQPPAFLSTHPSHKGRIKALEERMPEALKIQAAARKKGKRPDCKRQG